MPIAIITKLGRLTWINNPVWRFFASVKTNEINSVDPTNQFSSNLQSSLKQYFFEANQSARRPLMVSTNDLYLLSFTAIAMLDANTQIPKIPVIMVIKTKLTSILKQKLMATKRGIDNDQRQQVLRVYTLLPSAIGLDLSSSIIYSFCWKNICSRVWPSTSHQLSKEIQFLVQSQGI